MNDFIVIFKTQKADSNLNQLKINQSHLMKVSILHTSTISFLIPLPIKKSVKLGQCSLSGIHSWLLKDWTEFCRDKSFWFRFTLRSSCERVQKRRGCKDSENAPKIFFFRKSTGPAFDILALIWSNIEPFLEIFLAQW